MHKKQFKRGRRDVLFGAQANTQYTFGSVIVCLGLQSQGNCCALAIQCAIDGQAFLVIVINDNWVLMIDGREHQNT